jgi:hypothetical protein
MALKSLPATTMGQMLARGRTYDYEDSLVTYRLHTALKVLEAIEVVPTITHGTRTYYDWSSHRDKHWCALSGSGFSDCTISWPEWATGEMFDEAYRLASNAHRERGHYNRTKAYAAR